jgi:RNA polymerase sigma-70 factor (ECF subfamily)
LTVVPLDPDRAAAPSPASPPDWAGAVAQVAQAQDRDAFAGLFSHFAPRVKGWLVRTGSPEDQAEELAQETMVAVWRKAALFDPAQAAVSTWIFTIARNLRVDATRRQRPESGGPADFAFDELDDGQAGVAEQVDASRLARRVRDALHRLPPAQAQVLRLSFYDDEPHSRIATELGIPLGTVKSRVRLAVAQLRRLLEP